MTVANLSPSISYLENGVTLSYPVPFRFDPAGGLIVKRIVAGVVTTLIYGVNWTATGGATNSGGTLTLNASVNGATLKIERYTARTQQTDYVTNDNFPAEAHEAALDRACLINQEQDVAIGGLSARALLVPDGETAAELPAAAMRANHILGFGPTGQPETPFTYTQIALAIANATAALANQSVADAIVFMQSGGGAVARILQDKIREYEVTPQDFGAVGNGIADDTAAIIAALATGKNVLLPPGSTFKYTANISIVTDNQRLGGPGILMPVGAVSIIVTGGCEGVELDLYFSSPGHTGWAVKVDDANRVRIKRLYGADIYHTLYVTKCNVCNVDWLWAQARGAGIKWYGNDAARSDILHINFAVIDPADAEYGMNWDGNCHSLEVKYLALVGGKGFVIQNTDGVGTFPAIGKIGHFEQDYSTGIGIEIKAGLDYDFNMPYVVGAALDGIRIAATINAYEVRIHGGKSIGNGGYGINNLGGQLLLGASTALYANTAGDTNGFVAARAPRFAVSDTFYMGLSPTGEPALTFGANNYISYDSATNVVRAFTNAAEIFEWGPTGLRANLVLGRKVYATFAALNAAVPAPQNGDMAAINDANVPMAGNFGALVVGGGGNAVPVIYNGGAWRIG